MCDATPEAGTAGQRKFNRADAIGELGLEDDVPRVPDTLRDVVAISPPLPVLHLASSTLMQRKEVLSGAPVTAGRSERAIHCAGCQCGGPTVPSLGPAPPESQPGRYASLAIAHGASRRAGAQRHGTVSMKKHEHHSADLSCSTDGQSQAAATSDDDSDNTDDERSYAQRLVAEAAGPLSDLSSEASYHGDDSFEPAGVMFGEA